MSDGVVSGLFWNDVEIVTGIDYPVRDPDWGTWPTVETSSSWRETAGRLVYERAFTAGDFDGQFRCLADADGTVVLSVFLLARRTARTCRSGFVVLHPLAAAGGSLSVTAPDGITTHGRLPTLIQPAQPAMNIAAMRQEIDGIVVHFKFAGDVFEMEDQRNWSDASFKTFCRPLLLPYPFEVAEGERIEQTITIRVEGDPVEHYENSADTVSLGRNLEHPLPNIGLVIDPAWPQAGRIGDMLDAWRGTRFVARIDLAIPAHIDWLASLASRLDDESIGLEMIVDGQRERMDDQIREAATAIDPSGVVVSHVLALPRAYLRCIQPWHPTPDGVSPSDAVDAARRYFPTARIGAGMLTNFTELNRYPPRIGDGDYVTHSLTPLVHDASDDPVMRTLDTLSPIFATLDSHAAGRPYRLGLASIGMRTNPYGSKVADNEQQTRIAMAGADPRQRGLFGAAFMAGVAAATAGHHFEFIALAAPYGPFGLAYSPADWVQRGYDDNPGRFVFPAFHAFVALKRIAGRPRIAISTPQGVRAVAAGIEGTIRLVIANCTSDRRSVQLPRRGAAIILDLDTVDGASRDPQWLLNAVPVSVHTLDLQPFALAFVDLPDL